MDITYSKLVNSGIDQGTASSLEKCIRLTNVSALVLAASLIPYMALYGYHQLYSVFFTVTFLTAFNLFIPYLNQLGRNRLARVLFLVVNFGIGFINSTALGHEAFIYLYLIAGLPASVVLFCSSEQRLLFACLGWSVLLIVLDLILGVAPFFKYELAAEVLSHIRALAVLGSLICLLLFVLVFRKESEFAQRNYEQLMVASQILKNDLDAVFFCDLGGRIKMANAAAERLYGYTAEELAGRELGLLNSCATDNDAIQQALEGRCSWSGEISQRRKDGSLFIALFTQFIVADERGFPVGMAATGKDITREKQTEQALIEAKEKAEEAAIVKANFLATMSHEIRTPLNGVIGMALLLLEDEPKPEQVESLNVLKFAAENLLTLINDVLDFSKIDAGRVALEAIPFCFTELIRSIEASSRYQAVEKGIAFNLELDERLAQRYQTDPIRLTQVLLNLTSNAIKFTNQGCVTLSVALVDGDRGDAGDHGGDNVDVAFTVADTGIGIAEEKLEHIFDQFSQADSATTRHYGGSGLGLAITKGLLEAFGSEITVTSQHGKGTTFAFVLTMRNVLDEKPGPLPQRIRAENVSAAQSDYVERAFEGLSVLVAEDNPVNIMVIRKLLTKWGLGFDIVDNGEKAVRAVQEKAYDLVLMDIQMPVMDGFQATLAIRSTMKSARLPIIALTATATEEFKTEARAIGMNDYLSKPFNPNHLKSRIKQWCSPISRAESGGQIYRVPPGQDHET